MLDRQGAGVLVDAAAVEHAHFHHRTDRTGRQTKAGVFHVSGFFAEDRAQEFFLRRHRGFALGRNLADEDIAGADFRADMHDTGFVEVLERFLAHVRDVAGDFLGAEFRVAGHDLKLLDMDRGKDVIAHDAFGDEDRVLKVIAVPRHKRDQDIAAQRQFTELR